MKCQKGTHNNRGSRHQARLAQKTQSMLKKTKKQEGRKKISLIGKLKDERYEKHVVVCTTCVVKVQ